MSLLRNLGGRLQRAGSQLLLGGHVRVSAFESRASVAVGWVELEAPVHQGQPANTIGQLGPSLWAHAYAEAAYELDGDLRAALGDELTRRLATEVALDEGLRLEIERGSSGPIRLELSPALPRGPKASLDVELRHAVDARETLVRCSVRRADRPEQVAAGLLLLALGVVARSAEARRPAVRDTLHAFVAEFIPARPPRRARVDAFLREHAPPAEALRPFRRRPPPTADPRPDADAQFQRPGRRPK